MYRDFFCFLKYLFVYLAAAGFTGSTGDQATAWVDPLLRTL